jgi:hypothetical protein
MNHLEPILIQLTIIMVTASMTLFLNKFYHRKNPCIGFSKKHRWGPWIKNSSPLIEWGQARKCQKCGLEEKQFIEFFTMHGHSFQIDRENDPNRRN